MRAFIIRNAVSLLSALAIAFVIGTVRATPASASVHHLVWDSLDHQFYCLGSTLNCDFS